MQAKEMWRRDPAGILKRAVAGMLPKNNLRPDRLRKLRVFTGPEHPYGATPMERFEMPPRQLRDSGTGWVLPQGFAAMNPEAYARRMRGSKWVGAAEAGVVPVVGFDDMLTAQERAAVEAAVAAHQRQRSTGKR